MAGFKAKFRAAVVDQIIFCIKPAMDQLDVFVLGRPGQVPAPLGDRNERRQESAADILRECKIGIPVA